MKKKVLFFIFILTLLFNVNIVNAKSLDVKITDVKIIEKGGLVTAEDPEITDTNVTSAISFNQKDDYVTYEFTLKNNESDKYKIESVEDNNTNDSLQITYDYSKDYFTDEAKVKVKMLYKTSIEKNTTIDISNLTLKINLVKEDGTKSEVVVNNPLTGDNILMYVLFLILAISGFIFALRKTKVKGIKAGILVIALSLVVLPAAVLAVEKYEVSIKFSNIKVMGQYDSYSISVDPENGGDATTRTIKYGEKLGALPSAPSKNGYTFDKWVDQNGNEVTENTVVTSQIEVKAKYNAIEYGISYDLDGGTASNTDTYTIEDEITLVAPTKPGYTFVGWTGSNGETPSKTVTIKNKTGNLSYVAHYEVSELDFNGNDTLGVTYSDTAQTVEITGASNGAGNYTYTITEGNSNNYFSINGTTITIKENVPAGEYTIKVKAKDTETNAEKEATFVITVSKKAADKVTNVSVNSNGQVSFTNSSNSDGYLISVDGVNYTPVIAGDTTTTYNYLDEITASAGARTVYVKATNSDSGNYQESEPETVDVTVYTLSVNVNNADYGIVSDSSVNVISGATFTTNDNKITLSDGREITTTKKNLAGYTTTFTGFSSTSGTISQDTTITATYTREVNAVILAINSTGGTIAEAEGWTIVGETAIKGTGANEAIGTLPEVTKAGYTLAGWNTKADGTGEDVTEATVLYENTTIYAQWIEAQSTFLAGESFNVKLKRLAGQSNSYYAYGNYSIEEFKRSTTKPDISSMTNANILSTDTSTAPIYGWFDNGTIYYWTEDITPSLNSASGVMFYGLYNITNIDLTNIDTSNVTNMAGMFSGCSSLTSLDLSSFNTSNVKSMYAMFSGCSSLTSLDLGDNFDTSNVANMYEMFSGCSSLTSLDLGDKFDTSNVTNMEYMFQNCSSLTSLDLGDKFDTSNVTDMYAMFRKCSSLTSLDLGDKFDTSNVTDMYAMFGNCSSLTSLDLGDKFNPIKITSLSSFFNDLTNLEYLNLGSNFDTSNVIYMDAMFKNCSSLTSLDLGDKFDTSNVINMNNMFKNCSSLTSLDLGDKFDTSKVAYMNGMFQDCSSLTSLDISTFITNNVKNMDNIFRDCTNLQTIYASHHFVTDEVNGYNMFSGDTNLVGGAGTTYDSSYTDKTRAKIDEGSSNPGYFTIGVEQVTLKFKPAGGTVNVESKSVDKGLSVGSLPVANKDGYDFAGWYTDVTDGTLIDENSVINEDTTVFAHWVQGDLVTHIDKNNNEEVDQGDVIKIGAEEFYVVSTGSIIKLLTKYNLDNNYRQSKTGYIKTRYSDSDYWNEYYASTSSSSSSSSSSSDSHYGISDNYPYDYGGSYYVYRDRENNDTNNNIYDVVNNYKSHLIEDKGINVSDARLMKLEETTWLDCYVYGSSSTCPSFMREQDFWLGTTDSNYHDSSDDIYKVNKIESSDYDIERVQYYNNNSGIRPIIEIDETELLEKYTVSFEPNNGTSIDDIEVLQGKTIGSSNFPNTPTKGNMKFDGWYTDPSFITKFNYDTKVTKDITLYAKYKEWCKTFSTDSWSTIAANINENPEYYGYGCTKDISLDMDGNGTNETYQVRIANTSTNDSCKTKDDYSQTSCGVVIEFVTTVANKQMNSTSTGNGGWKGTELVTWLNSDFYNKLPSDLKNIIIPTYPIITNDNIDQAITSEDTDKNKIYLLSRYDIYSDSSYTNGPLDYYREYDQYKQTNNSRNKSGDWWLRNKYSSGSDYFAYWTSGYSHARADTNLGVAPAFRIGTPSYSVRFETDGGTKVAKQMIKQGGKATRPENPTKEFGEFVNWYTDNTYTTVFDFENTAITQETTVYAKYNDLCKGFSNESWSTIKNNINSDPNYYPVGCEKQVELDMDDDETNESYTVRIANTSTPEVCSTEGYSQTACGTVIEFVTPVANKQMNSTDTNAGGWKETELVTWLNGDFYNKLPSDLKNIITPTYPIVSGSGYNSSSENITAADTTKNKIYLLSTREIGLNKNYDNKKNETTDTRTLDYYLNGSRVKKNLKGYSIYWWLRSAISNYNNAFFVIENNGISYTGYANYTLYYVAPAFRIN